MPPASAFILPPDVGCDTGTSRCESLSAPEPEPEPAPEIVAEKVKIQVGGQRGARRSLKTKRVAKVVDHAAALAAFADAPEVHDVVAKLAQKAIDAGLPTPAGVEVTEVMKL